MFEFKHKQRYLIWPSESVRVFCLGKNKRTNQLLFWSDRAVSVCELILFSAIPVSRTVTPSCGHLKLSSDLRRAGMPRCKQLLEKSSLAHAATNFWCSCIHDQNRALKASSLQHLQKQILRLGKTYTLYFRSTT